MKTTDREIPIDQIAPPESPIRSTLDENSLMELAESIRALGMLQPILVKTSASGFIVIAGHRRLMAAKIIRMVKIPCRIVEEDWTTVELMALDENTKRENLTYIDEAKYLKRMQDEARINVKELATMVNHGERWVQSRLDMLSFPEDIITAITSKGMSLAVGTQLAQILDEAERIRLSHYAIEDGASANAARYWVQMWRSNPQLLTQDLSVPSKGNLQKSEGEFHYPCKTCGETNPISNISTLMICSNCLKVLLEVQNEPRKTNTHPTT